MSDRLVMIRSVISVVWLYSVFFMVNIVFKGYNVY